MSEKNILVKNIPTGKKDINGKEIHVGDIVQFCESGEHIKEAGLIGLVWDTDSDPCSLDFLVLGEIQGTRQNKMLILGLWDWIIISKYYEQPGHDTGYKSVDNVPIYNEQSLASEKGVVGVTFYDRSRDCYVFRTSRKWDTRNLESGAYSHYRLGSVDSESG